MMEETKYIGGRTYTREQSFNTKSEADSYANRRKKEGKLARVVKTKHGYYVVYCAHKLSKEIKSKLKAGMVVTNAEMGLPPYKPGPGIQLVGKPSKPTVYNTVTTDLSTPAKVKSWVDAAVKAGHVKRRRR